MAGKTLGVAESEPTLDALTVTGATACQGALTVTGATTLNGDTAIGNAAADLVAFHGATAVDQAAFISTQSINALSVSGVVGFTSSTSLSSFVGKLNLILDLLKEKGLMASS